LRRLLNEAGEHIETATQGGPDDLHEAVLTETRKLLEFTNRTEPKDILDANEVESIHKIDQAADEARRQIFGASAEVIVGRIHDRISDFNQLDKAIRQETARNEAEANKARLLSVRNAIDAIAETVQAAKNTKQSLLDADPTEAAVKDRLDGVLRAITALEKATAGLFETS
jgi:hypothetical protein